MLSLLLSLAPIYSHGPIISTDQAVDTFNVLMTDTTTEEGICNPIKDYADLREKITSTTINNLGLLLAIFTDRLGSDGISRLLKENPILVQSIYKFLNYPSIDPVAFNNMAIHLFGGFLQSSSKIDRKDTGFNILKSIVDTLFDKKDTAGVSYIMELLNLRDQVDDFINVSADEIISKNDKEYVMQYTRIFIKNLADSVLDSVKICKLTKNLNWSFITQYLGMLNDVIFETDKVTPEIYKEYGEFLKKFDNDPYENTKSHIIDLLHLFKNKPNDEFKSEYDSIVDKVVDSLKEFNTKFRGGLNDSVINSIHSFIMARKNNAVPPVYYTGNDNNSTLPLIPDDSGSRNVIERVDYYNYDNSKTKHYSKDALNVIVVEPNTENMTTTPTYHSDTKMNHPNPNVLEVVDSHNNEDISIQSHRRDTVESHNHDKIRPKFNNIDGAEPSAKSKNSTVLEMSQSIINHDDDYAKTPRSQHLKEYYIKNGQKFHPPTKRRYNSRL